MEDRVAARARGGAAPLAWGCSRTGFMAARLLAATVLARGRAGATAACPALGDPVAGPALLPLSLGVVAFFGDV